MLSRLDKPSYMQSMNLHDQSYILERSAKDLQNKFISILQEDLPSLHAIEADIGGCG